MNTTLTKQDLKREGEHLAAQLATMMKTKDYRGFDTLTERFDAWEAASAKLDFNESRAKPLTGKYAAVRAYGGDRGKAPEVPSPLDISTKGYQINPLVFDHEAIDKLTKSLADTTPVRTKAFNTVTSLLPAQLHPTIIERIHEHRFMDHAPTISCGTQNYEFIVDATTSNGVSGPTGEGQTKPDITLNLVAQTVGMVKLAATFGLSYETCADYQQILGYCQGEVTRQITHDLENAQFLNGSGTSGNMTGLINTSGILTNAVPGTLPTGSTYVDYFLDSINLLRIGPALAEADQVWIHPTTWRSVVKVKDGLGRYLVTPDPTRDPANAIFGVPVHVTTAMPMGTAVILDSTKWGYCIVREGLSIISGHNQSDFSQNIQRYAVEERVQIAVTRPSAILTLTGLPTS